MTTNTSQRQPPVAGGPLHYILVGALLVVCLVIAVAVIDEKRARWDGEQNLVTAYNLYVSGTFSQSSDESARAKPTHRREPAYPFLLAGALRMLAGEQPKGLACLLEPDPDCDELVRRLKMVNAALMVMLAVLTYLAAAALFGPGWFSIAALALFVTHTGLYHPVNRYLSEIPAALFLLSHAYFTYRLVQAPERLRWGVLSGLALSLLVLTKAIFMFYPVAIVVLLLGQRLLNRGYRVAALRGMLVACAIAFVSIGLWTARNVIVVDQYVLTRRGDGVLTLRAEYSTMNLGEYAAAIVYYTPYYGEKLAQTLLKPELYAKLDRRNPEGYQARRWTQSGVVDSRARQYPKGTRFARYRAALSVLAENWAMHFALTPVLIYRGAGIPAPNLKSIGYRPLAKRMMTFSRYVSFLFFPAMLFVLIATVRRRNWHILVFFLPAFYSIAAYAFLTHFMPRFSLPLVPHLVLALVWTVQVILARLVAKPTSAEPSQSNLSDFVGGRDR